jgi:signal transduction histidine kinase/ligand-binding sensor domain-containing protein
MNRPQTLCLLCLCLATIAPIYGQQTDSNSTFEQQARGHWRTYGVTDGLAALDVHDILRDRDGNMWFATEGGGVSRYDGEGWTSFDVSDGLFSNGVYDIVQDGAGSLWFRSPRGVSRFDGLSWTTFTEKDGLVQTSLADYIAVLFTDRDGHIWCGSFLGRISRYDGNQWTTFDDIDGRRIGRLREAIQDRNGNLWFATDDGAIRYQDGNWHIYDVGDGLAGPTVLSVAADSSGAIWFATTAGLSRFEQGSWTTFMAGTTIGAVLCASDGDVWVSTSNGGYRFDGDSWKSLPLTVGTSSVRTTFPAYIFEDSRGDIWFAGDVWFGGQQGGVGRHDGTRLRTYSVDDGLPHVLAAAIAEDPEGHLWFGTPGGVSRYDAEWLTFSSAEGLPHDTVRDVLEDDTGNIWLATDVGVSRYDSMMWRHFTTTDGLPEGGAWALAQDHDGQVWMISHLNTTHGAASFDGRAWGIEDAVAAHSGKQRLFDIFKDDAGRLWFGSDKGVAYLARASASSAARPRFDASDGMGDNYGIVITKDLSGQIWVANVTGGVSRYDGHRWRHFTTEDGMARGTVRAILVDREGQVWFASNGYGVTVFDGETFRILTTADGLAHNSLRSLMQSRDGHIWFGTDAGLVSRSDGEVFQTLTAEDGLTGQSVRAMIQDRKGDVWIGTYGGVVRFRQPDARSPSIGIDAVIADRRHRNPEKLSVPSTLTLVVFEFHGSSFRTRPDGMVYRYRLRGYDTEWHTTRERRVEYTDLPLGDYTFEILAIDRDLVRSETPATVALEIHAPYERYAWMSALGIALTLVFLQGTRIVRRDRHLIEANRQIEETTRNKSEFLRRMSHDLRSPMNAIIGYTRVVLRRGREALDERQVRNLENIETSSGNLLNLINDILDLSRIEAGHVEVNLQPVDMKRLAEECADALESIVQDDVVLRREFDDVGVINSDPDRLRQVVMNLLGNATKFTEAGSITLSLKLVSGGTPSTDSSSADPVGSDRASGSDTHIELSIADTGIGIPSEDLPHIFDEFRQVERQGGEAAEGTGLGLAIAKKTVELLGGQISATSEVGVGTTFTVRLGGVAS